MLSEFLILPNFLTSFEVQKYYQKINLNITAFNLEIIYLKERMGNMQ